VRTGDMALAREYFSAAIGLTSSKTEQAFLQDRLASIADPPGSG
jgi:predicted RNA polymerase sigma factor